MTAIHNPPRPIKQPITRQSAELIEKAVVYGDIETFVKEWQLIGNLNLERAISANNEGDFIRARENYFRASTYFKSAMITLNPLDIRHKVFWKLSVDFNRGAQVQRYQRQRSPGRW